MMILLVNKYNTYVRRQIVDTFVQSLSLFGTPVTYVKLEFENSSLLCLKW